MDTLAQSTTYSAIYPSLFIPSNGRIELFSVDTSIRSSQIIAELFQKNEFQLIINYSSIYDEVWQITSGRLVPEKID